MRRVRWGLLSTANINRRLIPAIRASARGELVAVASRSQASADAYAAEWEISQAFASYEAMLRSDAVDAVYIGLPNHLHAEWSIKAMAHGKHVLCEKPFALSLEEVDRMRQVADETGMVIAEAFMYRHHPQMKLAGELVHSGRLGDVVLVRGTFSFKLSNPENVRLIADYGGGSLWDVGCYPVSFAQYMLADTPEWVFGGQHAGESGVDEAFVGQMHYANGAMAQISSSFRVPFYTFVEVLGTEARLTMNLPFVGVDDGNAYLRIEDAADGSITDVPIPEEKLYAGEVADMHAAILEGTPNYLSLEASRNHVKTLLALYESARTRQPVRL